MRNYIIGFHGLLSSTFSAGGYLSNTFNSLQSIPNFSEVPLASNSSANSTTNSTANSTNKHHTRIRSYDFEFAYDVGILALSDEILETHKFEIINLTLSGSRQ